MDPITIASVGASVLKSAKKFLQKRGAKIAARAEQIRQKADVQAKKREKIVAEINKVTGSDMGEYAQNPIKASAAALSASTPDLVSNATKRGTALGGPKGQGSMMWVIGAALIALLVLPKIAKGRR